MFCARCGQQIAEGTQACPHCGQPPVIAWQNVPAPIPAAVPAPAPYLGAIYYRAAPAELRGVQGWLLFFCISLAIVWPIWVLAYNTLSYTVSFHLHQHFAISPALVASWLRLAFGIATGIVVWRRMRAGIAFLRVYYLIGVALAVWSLNVWVHILIRAKAQPGIYIATFIFSLAPSFAFLLSGLLYFSLSKRVRNTLGSNLFG